MLLTLSAKSEAALDVATATTRRTTSTGTRNRTWPTSAFTLHVGRRAFRHRRARRGRPGRSRRGGRAPRRRRSGSPATEVVDVADGRLHVPGSGRAVPGHGARALRRPKPSSATRSTSAASILRARPRSRPARRAVSRRRSRRDDADAEAARHRARATGAVRRRVRADRSSGDRGAIEPTAMIGHSVGEFVAATLAGVMDLEDALATPRRARSAHLRRCLPGSHVVGHGASRRHRRLPRRSDRAGRGQRAGFQRAVGTDRCDRTMFSVSSTLAIRRARRLHTSHAFHSSMMDPILAPFERDR